MNDESVSDAVGGEVEFDDLLLLALAQAAGSDDQPRASVKERLMARVDGTSSPLPPGFSIRPASEDDWLPHPVPGIRMKVLATNRKRGYVTLLLDVAPGSRFPAHHHDGDEECYVISGSLVACGRRLGPGDFHHADGDTDHGELWTDEGCRVILVVPPDDYLPGMPSDSPA